MFVCVFVCVCAVGVSHEELCALAESKFSNLPPIPIPLPKMSPCRYTGSEMRARDDDMPYAHIAMAVEVCSRTREISKVF